MTHKEKLRALHNVIGSEVPDLDNPKNGVAKMKNGLWGSIEYFDNLLYNDIQLYHVKDWVCGILEEKSSMSYYDFGRIIYQWKGKYLKDQGEELVNCLYRLI